MRCTVCAVGEVNPKLVRYSLSFEEKLVVVEHVPANVCDNCGETSFTPDVVEKLQETVWHSRKPVKTLETPVYEFA